MARNATKSGANPPRYGSMIPNRRRKQQKYNPVMFRGVADAIVADASANSNPVFITTDTNGTLTNTFALNTLGLVGLNAANTTATSIEKPHLPWLYRTASNFEEYRVTRASLVLVAGVGTTTTGEIAIQSSPNYADLATTSFGQLLTGGASYAVSGLAAGNQNKKVPLRVDSSWKKVSFQTQAIINGGVMTLASADDLDFSCVNIRVTNAPATQQICMMFVEYDVEFRGPVNPGINA